MPKSIIREFDNSKTGNALSVNFSVFVPGYATDKAQDESLKAEAKKLGILYEDDGIYELTSTAQFERYIGKKYKAAAAKAPELEPIGEPGATPSINDYARQLVWGDLVDLLQSGDYNYYTYEELDEVEPDGRLKLNIGGKTYAFVKASAASIEEELRDDEASETPTGQTERKFVRIDVGNEGENGNDCAHLGNQIAYELLRLGYVVYFKIMDDSKEPATELANDEFWEPLKQKSIYRIRYLTTGGCATLAAQKAMQRLAAFNNAIDIDIADEHDRENSGRGDVIALCDIDEESPEIRAAAATKSKKQLLKAFGEFAGRLTVQNATKYSAVFAPRVVYDFGYPEGDEYSSDVKFPASFHYLACAAKAQQKYSEWYAVAGYQRGVCDLAIQYLTFSFGDLDVNTLSPRLANTYTENSVNLILTERGNHYIWANRTLEKLDNKGLRFSHFLNIRQLCATLKQALYDATRQFNFEPNSDMLWINFVSAIKPTLEHMKSDQGIRAYRISRVQTDKKALLVAKIRIVPIEAIEDFDISVYLEDSLNGIIVSADEQEAE